MTADPLSLWRPAALGLAAIAVLVLGIGLWSVTARLQGAVVLQGSVVPDPPAVTVQHPEGGVVQDLLVAEGDVVAAGAVLLRLDGAALRSDLTIVEDRLAELSARAARLAAERDDRGDLAFPPALLAQAPQDPKLAAQLDGQRALFAARRASLAAARQQLLRQIDQLGARSDGLLAQQSALLRERALLVSELAAQQSLFDRGLVPATALHALQREIARLDGQTGAVAAARGEAAAQRTGIEIEIAALVTRRAEAAAAELRDIAPTLLELGERRRALVDRIGRLDLRASVAGVVFGLQVTAPGAVLRAAEPALQLVPDGGAMVVIAPMPPLHLDQVHAGQTAVLSFPGLAGTVTPELGAVVSQVSPDVISDPATGEARVLVRLTLPPGGAGLPDGTVLRPGMPVTVYLRTDDHTPLDYLTAPFTAYFSRALREG